MPVSNPRNIGRVYSVALSSFADSGDTAGADKLLALMRVNGVSLSCTMLNSMIRLCANTGSGVAAEYWLGEICKMGLCPNRASFCGVIRAWAKAGDLKKVGMWIQRLGRVGIVPPKGICRPVVRILLGSKADDAWVSTDTDAADRASAWLLQAHSLGVPLDRSTINLVMAIYARSGDVEKTERLASVMQKARIMANQSTLCALVTASRRAGDEERANMWLKRMAQIGFEPGDLDSHQKHDFFHEEDDPDETTEKGGEPEVAHEGLPYNLDTGIPHDFTPQKLKPSMQGTGGIPHDFTTKLKPSMQGTGGIPHDFTAQKLKPSMQGTGTLSGQDSATLSAIISNFELPMNHFPEGHVVKVKVLSL
jgi:pentatricopeptide repeat protein